MKGSLSLKPGVGQTICMLLPTNRNSAFLVCSFSFFNPSSFHIQTALCLDLWTRLLYSWFDELLFQGDVTTVGWTLKCLHNFFFFLNHNKLTPYLLTNKWIVQIMFNGPSLRICFSTRRFRSGILLPIVQILFDPFVLSSQVLSFISVAGSALGSMADRYTQTSNAGFAVDSKEQS